MYQEHVHNFNRKKTKKFKLREWHIPSEVTSSLSVATVAYNLVQLYKTQVNTHTPETPLTLKSSIKDKCHQCKKVCCNPSMSVPIICSNISCKKLYCTKCLWNRYQEAYFDIKMKNCDWFCPNCRNICNCIDCNQQQCNAALLLKKNNVNEDYPFANYESPHVPSISDSRPLFKEYPLKKRCEFRLDMPDIIDVASLSLDNNNNNNDIMQEQQIVEEKQQIEQQQIVNIEEEKPKQEEQKEEDKQQEQIVTKEEEKETISVPEPMETEDNKPIEPVAVTLPVPSLPVPSLPVPLPQEDTKEEPKKEDLLLLPHHEGGVSVLDTLPNPLLVEEIEEYKPLPLEIPPIPDSTIPLPPIPSSDSTTMQQEPTGEISDSSSSSSDSAAEDEDLDEEDEDDESDSGSASSLEDYKERMKDMYQDFSGETHHHHGHHRHGHGRISNAYGNHYIDHKTTILVRNLSYTCTTSELGELFKNVGEIDQITIPLDRSTNKFKGYGFVKFKRRVDAENAIAKYHGSMFKDRIIELEWSKDKTNRKYSQDYNNFIAATDSMEFMEFDEHVKKTISIKI